MKESIDQKIKKASSSQELERELHQITQLALNYYAKDSEAQKSKKFHYGKILEEHLINNEKVKTYYQKVERESKEHDKIIKTCKDQIANAKKTADALLFANPNEPLPIHSGYNKLILILEKKREYKAIVELCQQAKEQGWQGDWSAKAKSAKKLLRHSPKGIS